MKNTILLFLLWFLCHTVSAQEVSDFIYTGNTIRYNTSTIGNNAGTIGGAVQLTVKKLELLKGNNITRVRFYQKSNEVENARIFITASLEGEYDYVQTVQNIEPGWNDITLTQAFPINGVELFMGCEINAQLPLIGTNTNTENGLNDWFFENGEWKHANGSHGMCIIGIVQGDKLPHHNVSLTSAEVPYYQLSDKPFSIKGSLFNQAVETIHTITVNIGINGREPIEQTIDNLNIAYLSSGSFTIENIIIPDENNVSFSLEVTKENGSDDLDMGDNKYVQNIFCRKEFVQRKMLIEMFSTESCSNCPKGHKEVEKAMGDNPEITMVNHHSAYGTDPYTIEVSKEYLYFYNPSNGTFAPAVMFDRTCLGHKGAEAQGKAITPILSIRSNLKDLMDYAFSIPAHASIEVEANYQKESRTLNISTNGKSVLPLSGTDSRLNIFITEDSIFTAMQAGAPGNYRHNHTIRQTLTGTWGEPVTLEQGFDTQHTLQIPDEWNDKNLNVVAFVSNYDAEDRNNCVIYNCDFLQLFPRTHSGIQNIPENPIRLHTLKNAISIDGEFKSLDIYSTTGNKVAQFPSGIREINTTLIQAGIYLFRFETKEGNYLTLKTNIYK